MMRDVDLRLLPKEHIEILLQQILLLREMYMSVNSVSRSEPTTTTLEQSLQAWVDNEGPLPSKLPTSFEVALDVSMSGPAISELTIVMSITVPLKTEEEEDPVEPPPIKARIQSCNWLNKSQMMMLSKEINDDDDAFIAIENVQRELTNYYNEKELQQQNERVQYDKTDDCHRVWFYFPSISTKEKRNDIVYHATEFALTGFLLAGKPGVLCLEGPEKSVDSYMKYIKTESWGDIPSHQKKVSERYRERIEERAFQDMIEITDLLEKHGQKNNRGDMRGLEAWLNEKGLGEAFEKVVM